jgi:hypothetical protein
MWGARKRCHKRRLERGGGRGLGGWILFVLWGELALLLIFRSMFFLPGEGTA